jgi:formimidoylglutamate deiminase
LPNQAFHIHIAEQLKEVEDAQRNLKQRPVEWLFSNIEVDQHFHLVHATHITAKEMEMILTSRANVVICPSTEANLGDGIFPFNAFYAKNGNWSIGTDSHIGLNHLEELRWLDYGQRLIHHQRTSFIHQGQPDGAQNALISSWKGGRNAMGLSSKHFFEIGDYFDAVVIDASEPLIATTSLKHLCNTVLYAQNQSMIYGTISAGKWIVKQGKHQHAESIKKFC